jgi:hypothetical protein
MDFLNQYNFKNKNKRNNITRKTKKEKRITKKNNRK